ncbi:MAG: plasmid pRiA4b ORF-3 family protein [Bacteroidales bacterium]|nr:plasmid pRiA4b ORF-3 family protein [Bacteroidales bacterium]
MTTQIYQLKISLRGSQPAIWRKLLVPSDLLLPVFHDIIQIAMGWEDGHLHQFIKDRVFYMPKMADDGFWDDMDSVDYTKIKLSDLLEKEKDKIIYEYDFGDSWEHDIVLEKILPVDSKQAYPFCLGGKMACPPEDCGGVWGYESMLQAIQDPKHEEHEDILEWLGEDFDPKYFDAAEVNAVFKKVFSGKKKVI